MAIDPNDPNAAQTAETQMTQPDAQADAPTSQPSSIPSMPDPSQGGSQAPQTVSNPNPNPNPVSAADPYADHPSVMRAGILQSVARALAGNPTTVSIDPATGVTTRRPAPVSGRALSMAIALEALSGGIAGLAQTGPNHAAKAAQAGFQQGQQQVQQAPTATSIRDTVQQVADGLKTKAKGLYTTLDNIPGGQAQRFRDAAENIADKLSEIVGLDDEKEAELVKRQGEIEAAHKAMLDDLEAKGYDRNMLQQADATWKQQSALSDLSNSIRQSTAGLRPELANGIKGATTPETVNPKTLFTKVNRLNDRGRLAQAIGQDNANALLQHIDSAYVQAQKIAARNKWLGYIAKAAGVTGAGAAGVHLAHELLGSGQ